MARRVREGNVAVKAEAVPGTPETTFTDAEIPCLIYEGGFDPEQQSEERKPMSPFFGSEPSAPGPKKGTVSFQTELFAALNHLTTAAPWVPYALFAGLVEKPLEKIALSAVGTAFRSGELITAGGETARVAMYLDAPGDLYLYDRSGTLTGSVTGDLGGAGNISGTVETAGRVLHPVAASASHILSSVRSFSDGHIEQIAGALSTLNFNATVGETVKLQMEAQGKRISAAEGPTLKGLRPPVRPDAFLVADCDIKMGSSDIFKPSFETIEVNAGNTVGVPLNANDPTGAGYENAVITDRDPSGSIDMLAPLISEHDVMGHWENATEGWMTFKVGATAGRSFMFHLGNIQYTNLSTGERESLLTYNMDLRVNRTNGDDEFHILCI